MTNHNRPMVHNMMIVRPWLEPGANVMSYHMLVSNDRGFLLGAAHKKATANT